jgi:hypothetical protein
MSNKFVLAAALAAVFAAVPALAENSCGTEPLAPAIPPASDLSGKTADVARAEVYDSYKQVKAFQAALKPYRDCLLAASGVDKKAVTDAQANPDKDSKSKITALEQDMSDLQKAYDHTLDTEQQVANDFNTLHMADCKTDTDPNVCPKKK